MKTKAANAINWIIEKLRKGQSGNGSWDFPFETGISTDAYMIILLRSLEIDDELLLRQLSDRISSRQEANGAWKLFEDEEGGNVSATIEAYYALLYAGFLKKEEPIMIAARKFLLANGRVEKANLFTKMLLCMTGQLQWPKFFPFPIEMILLPTTFPLNFYSLSVFGRANLAPVMILSDQKPQFKTTLSPNLANILGETRSFHFYRTEEWRSLHSFLENGVKYLVGLPYQLHMEATERTKQYMLGRIEADGTLYNYFSSTFLMIFALLALGYSKKDPIIEKAVKGLLSMKTEMKGHTHIQYTNASVWNTSLLSTALQAANVSPDDPMIKRANRYLLSRQHYKYGDWTVHNPNVLPGGWGFSDMNTINPDVDDTTATLRSLAEGVTLDPAYHLAWDRGIEWLLSMQNGDGGWPAFEKGANSPLLKLLPIEKGDFLLSDPTCADLTGRTLEFLGRYTNLSKNHPAIKHAVNWLDANTERDGSWYGRWGICYIYGTWSAVTGMRAVGVLSSHASVAKAVKWLVSIQHSDGGWGESCRSDMQKKYVDLGASTITHTAWAVDALISASNEPTPEIKAGINYLVNHIEIEDWTNNYPVGQGMAGGLYINYHSYRYVFPLIALADYCRKFEK